MKVKFSKSFYSFMKFLSKIVLYPIYRPKFSGKFSIPDDGRYIFASNHVTALDAVLIGNGQKHTFRFMAKAELFRTKIGNWFFTKLGCFPVDRGKGDWNAINMAEQMIDEGYAIGIFIEGTRSKTGELLRPKSGAAMIAHRMNCKIVPVSISFKAKKKRFFSRMYISFGEPVTTEELGIVNGTPREFRDASRKIMDKISVMWEKDRYGN